MSDDIYEIEEVVPGMSCRCVSDYSCGDWVAIPRARHEAYEAALEKHKLIARMQTSQRTAYADFSAAKHHAEEALRIARAALEADPSGKEE